MNQLRTYLGAVFNSVYLDDAHPLYHYRVTISIGGNIDPSDVTYQRVFWDPRCFILKL